MSSATSQDGRSPPSRPNSSSPSSSPSPPRSAVGDARQRRRGRPLTRRSRRKSSHSAKLDTRRPSPPPAWTPDPSSSTSAKRPLDIPASLGNQPRRRPPSQRRVVPDRPGPAALASAHQGLHGTAAQAGQVQKGDHPLPQTLRRPGGVRSAQPDKPRHPHPSRLTSMGASLIAVFFKFGAVPGGVTA